MRQCETLYAACKQTKVVRGGGKRELGMRNRGNTGSTDLAVCVNCIPTLKVKRIIT